MLLQLNERDLIDRFKSWYTTGHSVLNIIQLFDKELKYFRLYGSQSCESFFRTARSMSSSESTQINFSANDFRQNKCKYIDVLNRLKSEGKEDGISYPRLEKEWVLASKEKMHTTPSLRTDLLAALEDEMKRARVDALQKIQSLGKIY